MVIATSNITTFDMIITIVNCLSPFLLIVFTSMVNRREKKRDAAAEAEKAARADEVKKQEERFQKIEKSIDELGSKIEEMNKCDTIKKLDEQMTRVISINETFLKYNTSLSAMISAIGRGVLEIDSIDPNVANQIRTSIEDQTKLDHELQVNLYKVVY